MAKIGRPRKEINWPEVDKLLMIQCTDEEISGWFDIDVKTLKACCKRDQGMPFSQYSEQKRAKGKISLRRALWQKALDPKNTAATIFACKTMLGLREHDESHSFKVTTPDTSIVYQSEWSGTFESEKKKE